MALSGQMSFTIAFLIGLIPAFVLLYITLVNYEKYINDKFMFFAILTGLFLGTLVSFFHLILSTEPAVYSSLLVFIMVIISFAIFENLVKIVFVQLKRFGAEYDTTYYGATFGIVIGASITIGRTYAIFSGDLGVSEIIAILLFALGIILMNGAMGAWLGYGCHKRDLKWSFIYAVLISIPFTFFVFLWYIVSATPPPSPEDPVLIGIGFGYALVAFLYAYYRIMPEALPLKHKRHRVREARRRAREQD